MTKKEALQIVAETINAMSLDTFTTEQKAKVADALGVISAMREQLSKTHPVSSTTNERRKAATANARAVLVAKIAPVLRKYLASDITAKDLYNAAKAELPADFSAAKVQNILLREMEKELIKTEAKNKPNVYRLK